MLVREEDRDLIPQLPTRDVARHSGPSHVILQDSARQLTRAFGAWVVNEPFPEPVRRDVHQAFEIGVILSGRQERYFDDLQLTMGAGELYLSPAWECHGWRTLSSGTQTLMIHFLPDFLGEERFEGTSWLTLFAAPASERPYAIDQSLRKQVLTIAEELVREVHERSHGWMAAARLTVLRLLLALWREWAPMQSVQEDRAAETSDLGRLAPAIDLVRARPSGRTRVEDGARACALGRSQFSALFRRTMGLSFGQFVSRYRVLKAAEAILGTHLSLGDIASELGFVDGAHLHRCFRQHFGCTPGQYRKGEHPGDVLPSR